MHATPHTTESRCAGCSPTTSRAIAGNRVQLVSRTHVEPNQNRHITYCGDSDQLANQLESGPCRAAGQSHLGLERFWPKLFECAASRVPSAKVVDRFSFPRLPNFRARVRPLVFFFVFLRQSRHGNAGGRPASLRRSRGSRGLHSTRSAGDVHTWQSRARRMVRRPRRKLVWEQLGSVLLHINVRFAHSYRSCGFQTSEFYNRSVKTRSGDRTSGARTRGPA